MTRLLRVLAFALFAAGACGGTPPTTPTPLPPAAPALSCPANVATPIIGGELVVNYPAAVVTGGSAPVNVTCSLASGAMFPVGQTTVTCTAVDAIARRAECSFSVTLTSLKLNATTFVAFGDSVTEGIDGAASMRVERLMAGDPALAYPAQLQSKLRADYPAQAQDIIVFNEGRGGERAADPESYARLGAVLSARRPQVLLLLDGYNDLLGDGIDAANDVGFALRDDIRLAKSMGVQHVFLSNLTPPGLTGPRRINKDVILEANFFIGQVASQEGATLVNAYDVFLGLEALLITDGLHLNSAGAELLAKTFHAAVVGKLGEKPPSAAVASRALTARRARRP